MQGLEFSKGIAWEGLYGRYIPDVTTLKPNDSGWVNFQCVLPTHPKKDRDRHGSINVYSGSYRCWSEECRATYNRILKKSNDSKVLSAREFLRIIGTDEESAAMIAADFSRGNVDAKQNIVNFIKGYPGELPGAREFIQNAQSLLKSDLDIVNEYCSSRGLAFQTLKDVGTGYVPPSESQEECLVLPYFWNGKIVGLRGRTIDGRKTAAKNSWLTLYNTQSLETFEKSPAVIVVEGETDCLALQQMLKYAELPFPVVASPGVRFETEWARHFQGRRVVVIPQADRASESLLRDIHDSFPPTQLEVIALPWKPYQWGKDVSDFIQQNGIQFLLDTLSRLQVEDKPRVGDIETVIRLSLTEPKWIIEGLIERGTKTLLVGQPKVGKTFIAMEMVNAVATGGDFLGVNEWNTVKGKALLVEEEGSVHRVAGRFAAIFAEDDDESMRAAFLSHRRGLKVDDPNSLELLCEDVKEIMPDLLVIDPYASIHNQDENTVQGTQVVIDALNRVMAINPEMALVVIHHTPKSGETARGSSALFGAVDTQINVDSHLDGKTVSLRIVGRDLPPGYAGDMIFEFDPNTGKHKSYKVGDMVKSNGSSEGSTRARIKQYLFDHQGEWFVAEDIARNIGTSLTTAKNHLKSLSDEEEIESEGDGTRGDKVRYSYGVES